MPSPGSQLLNRLTKRYCSAWFRFTMKAVLEEGTSTSTTLSGAKTIEVNIVS